MAMIITHFTPGQSLWFQTYGEEVIPARVVCVLRQGVVFELNGEEEGGAVLRFYEDEGTNVGWRCWNQRPDEGEREAVWRDFYHQPDVYDNYMDPPLGYNPWQE